MKNYDNSEELWHEKWKIMTILNIGDYSEHSWQLLPIKTYDKCDTSIVNILTNRHKFEIETISNTIEIYFKPFKFQVSKINVAPRGIQWSLPNCKKIIWGGKLFKIKINSCVSLSKKPMEAAGIDLLPMET